MATSKKSDKAAPLTEFYQAYSSQEDQDRTNVHYEQPVEFFYLITGGRWNVYSGNIWDAPALLDDTASQEAKLDLFAKLTHLQPGQRILDVGCGWGGPLTYLCQKYHVQGVGLTLSPKQQAAAEARIAREGVDAQIHVQHWRAYQDNAPFDVIYTDEVIVHFHDLEEFFRQSYDLLKPGGYMLNKELHYAHPRYSQMNRAISHINEIYGFTGNYRPLAEELAFANNAGFDINAIHQIPRAHYVKTIERWLANMESHKTTLVGLVGEEYYRRFKVYLKVVYRTLCDTKMTLDVIVSQKPILKGA